MKLLQITILVVTTIVLVSAQQGPVPPRLNIPGAAPIPIRPQFRNERLGVRVRRPILRPQTSNSIAPPIAPRIIDDPKPVTESTEDEINDPFIPQLLREQQQPQPSLPQSPPQYAVQAPNFFNEPNSIQQDAPEEEPQPQPPRFIERPAPPPQPRPQPVNDFGAQRFAIERQQQRPQPQPQQISPVRTRASNREPRPQYEQQRPKAKPIQPRPIDQNNLSQDDYRPRKPVAQILRKYRDENPDGSITWGYENDDGSFKEELIGTDCITKGTYGYVDPEGNKREYHYETGIKCDPNNRNPEGQDAERNGFINYEQNKAILPNGLEIDLSTMGKKKSKRPGAILQSQPQQYFRN